MEQGDDGLDAVAREAARLMAALGAGGAPRAESSATDSSSHTSSDGTAAQSDRTECACPALCRRCPVCRIGAAIAQVSPETLDRVADLLAMAASSLQSAAEHRRDDNAARTRGSADPAAPAAAPEQRPGDRHGWDDVEVDDGTDTEVDGSEGR